MKIQFLGATSTVTGSKTRVEVGETQVLVDCGLFQGLKSLRLRNWQPLPFDPTKLSAVLLTHAHVDHCGLLPLLVKNGFRGPIFSTRATRDLCSIILPDSGFLQEEEARYANQHGFSKHHPALPLYTEKDAKSCLHSFKTVEWDEVCSLGSGRSQLNFRMTPAGHLFGAASILIDNHRNSILFSGDLGRDDDPLTRSPSCHFGADAVVIESTYGQRLHESTNPKQQLKDVVLRTFARSGVLVIPTFAVGRAQLVLLYLRELLDAGEIPSQPIYINSPMANQASAAYVENALESKLDPSFLKRVCETAKPIGTVEESQRLNEKQGPMIILAASGMATGGRVLHHLKAFSGDSRNTLLFVGFQAAGTRGEAIVHGARDVKIHGSLWPIRAEVVQLESMSAHADREGLLKWVSGLRDHTSRFYVNHGEASAAEAMRRALIDRFNIDAIVPENEVVYDVAHAPRSRA